jgi:hypothetical protein
VVFCPPGMVFLRPNVCRNPIYSSSMAALRLLMAWKMAGSNLGLRS